jgi:voltage-gated potassium channel
VTGRITLFIALYLLVAVLLFPAIYALLGNVYTTDDDGKPVLFTSKLDLVYFSIATITTTGYGDFTARGLSRVAASCEMIIGVLLIGYVLARLVSNHDNQST